jgi:hypothetical protein
MGFYNLIGGTVFRFLSPLKRMLSFLHFGAKLSVLPRELDSSWRRFSSPFEDIIIRICNFNPR